MNLKVPFKIDYPLEILDSSRKIDFSNLEEREELFKRNIYYYRYGQERNKLLEEKKGKYRILSERLLDYMGKNHPSSEVLSVSLFGSSLFLEQPGDFDFLTIVRGNDFLLEESEFSLENESVPVGISIKGLDNFVNGFSSSGLKDPKGRLEPIIDRTAISLFRRHLPIFGSDFINNAKVFSENIYAQVSDLLHNAYELYYEENNKVHYSDKQRSRKILSRTYEAVSYLAFLEGKREMENFRKRVFSAMKEGTSLSESKHIFNEIATFYKNKVIHQGLLKMVKGDNDGN